MFVCVCVLTTHCVSSKRIFFVSDMWTRYICLLVIVALSTAMPAIDTGIGPFTYGSESLISNFAVLTDNNLDSLPAAFTICSSFASNITGTIHPFQLLHTNGKPWISLLFHAPEKPETNYQLTITVSFKDLYQTKKLKAKEGLCWRTCIGFSGSCGIPLHQKIKFLESFKYAGVNSLFLSENVNKSTKNWYTVNALCAIFEIFTTLDTFTKLLQY